MMCTCRGQSVTQVLRWGGTGKGYGISATVRRSCPCDSPVTKGSRLTQRHKHMQSALQMQYVGCLCACCAHVCALCMHVCPVQACVHVFACPVQACAYVCVRECALCVHVCARVCALCAAYTHMQACVLCHTGCSLSSLASLPPRQVLRGPARASDSGGQPR
jgi:hypothetical protein